MPIAKLTPSSEPVVRQPAPIEAKATPYKGIAVNHRDTPVETMLAYVEGMPWSVDYYAQIIGEHNNLQEIDPGQNAAYQQYQKIVGLELRVDSPLSSSYDSENSITTVSGNSTIIHVVPNVNDYFVSDAGSDEQGLFRITSVSRTTFNHESVYDIEYMLVCYTREDSVVFTNIENKTVRTYYFSKDRLVNGMSPLLQQEEYADSLFFERSYGKLVQKYFAKFFNRAMMLLLVPGQEDVVYDVRLANFLEKIIDSSEAREIRDLKFVSVDHDRYMSFGSLWSVLLSRSPEALPSVEKKSTLVTRDIFSGSSWIAGASFWRVNKYVYPNVTKDDAGIEFLNGIPAVISAGDVVGTDFMTNPLFIASNTVSIAGVDKKIIKNVLCDDYYVLSQAFYDGTGEMSILEILIKDYLRVQTLDRTNLKSVLNAYDSWPVLEQFYYGPLLILLLKECIRNYYS